MPDYIYLLENRLSIDQQNALRHLREAAREAEMILFLTGDAVRDLTSGHAVRELEVAVQGDALKLKKIIERLGGKVWGEDGASRSLYLCFPGTVRVDVLGTSRVEYKTPGQPIYHPASIQEDLRRRDFTVNAMAISLNEGSFGLLMDPLNGAADIEARTLRLVSNYGFIEEPELMIRATRYRTRLGWELDPRSQQRYENAKGDGAMEALSAHARSRELEQIGHEDDGLKVLQALEAEGWMQVLFPQWSHTKADEVKLKAFHDLAVELLMQGVHADISAGQFQLLTAKMAPKDLATLKKQLLRPGFVEEWNSLDDLAAGFQKVLLAKENQTPSTAFKLFTSYDPEAVLWLGFTTKDSAVKERFNLFLKVWPEMRQRVPYALMQEMRIRPELPNYNEIIHAVFLELIDGRLTTPEEMRAFLEPYSPPAPPPQITIKRSRGKRGGEPKVKETFEDEEDEDRSESDEEVDDMGGDEDDIGLGMPRIESDGDEEDDEDEGDDEEEIAKPQPAKRAAKAPAKAPPAKPAPAPIPAPAPAAKAPVSKAAPAKAAPAKVATPPKPEPKVEHKPAKPAPHPVKHHETKPVAKTPAHAPAKHAPAPAKGKHVPPAKKATPAAHHNAKPAKPAAKKAAVKPAAKPASKSVAKHPAKSVGAKAAAKKPKLVAVVASKTLKSHSSGKSTAKKSAAKPAKKR